MSLSVLWVIAYRDLARNWRRSLFTLIAVALGLALLIIANCFVAGTYDDVLENAIRLQTGHLQLRASSYEEEKLSLRSPDLLDNTEALVANATALSEVKAATPVLWGAVMLHAGNESAGLRLSGIETGAAFYAPVRESLVAGEFLTPDDRDGIVIGKRLADSLGIGVGRKVSLTIINADGQADEGIFTIRGIFSTGIVSYDESSVFMPLAKAQAFARSRGRASAIVMTLQRQEDAEAVATTLQSPGITAQTWRDMNRMTLQTVETGKQFYLILDAIVMLIVAVLLANTLLMAVFERVQEMGLLAALGMKGRQIMLMILLEASALGLVGILLGIVLGSMGVAYLATVGISLGEAAAATVQNMALGTTMYARFVPGTVAALSVAALVVIELASLYPAWFAARLEPVEALRSL
jgi:ABC-type lipoprotein release transport system permease subunit